MMKKSAMIIFLVLLCVPYIFAQVVSSGKVTIHINNVQPAVKINEQQSNIMIREKADVTDKTDESIKSAREVYGDYYALIIGIDSYTDSTINKRADPIEDANLFHELITTRYAFEKENVSFLKNATFAEIKDALDSFSEKVGPGDNFLIFYTGQSYWDFNSETGFWLPSDALGIGFWFIPTNEEDSDKLSWLSNNMLGNYLQKIKTKHTLLITDACFGGSLFHGRDVAGENINAINLLNEMTGRKAMTSGIISNETIQNDFIKYLNDYLEQNNEEFLPSEKLFINFTKTVSGNLKLNPQFGEISNSGDEGGDFIFILRN